MVVNKPYVYLNEAVNPPQLEVIVQAGQTGNFRLISTGVPGNNGVYFVDVELTQSASGSPQPKASIPYTRLSGYSNQTKIMVRLKQNGVTLGRTFVVAGQQGFESDTYKLFSYLQFVRSGTLTYHGFIDLGTDAGNIAKLDVNSTGAINLANAPIYEILLSISIGVASTTAPPYLIFSYNINNTEYYDPSTFETISMLVTGDAPKKTKGSTTDSEADASGDD